MSLKELNYPFINDEIIKRKKSYKRLLLEQDTSSFTPVRIAVLGGSTTRDIVSCLELFLLNYGIKATFYESEYNKYFEDAMFSNPELDKFKPEIIYIHTSNRNITNYPDIDDSNEIIFNKLNIEYEKLEEMWNSVQNRFNCQIIQNNFEPLHYRLMGNRESYDIHGKLHFIHQLNDKIYNYAQKNDKFHINDIEWIASSYGLEKWLDSFYWHMYKYTVAVPAIPTLSFNVANIVKSLYGKNKKALVLDLDNTLWGGVIGDDGVDNIEIGSETSQGQVYSEFQNYIKQHKKLGVILNVNSKNDYDNAIAGLEHPESILKKDDFLIVKANWNPKYANIREISEEMNILPESMVFVDDNPVERENVIQQFPSIGCPNMNIPENYISIIDRSGFFETTNFSSDDKNRTKMYEENAQRIKMQNSFVSYNDFLQSLKMKAIIKPFDSIYLSRIAQLTNKTNQFNLTTKRYSLSEIERVSKDNNFIHLYGKLIDKFGDNGLVSVIIGKKENKTLHIDLWIMSCRVLKRDMELAMLDKLISICKKENMEIIKGYYYPTNKNLMVKDFYKSLGFKYMETDIENRSIWELDITEVYNNKNQCIYMEE